MSDPRTDYRLMFPSDYIAAPDLMGRDAPVVIESVKVENLKMAGGKSEDKPVVRFVGKKKALVLNKTNARTIAKLHGNQTDEWVGKGVTLYPTTTTFGRETVDCLRIRPTAPNIPTAGAKPAESHPTADEIYQQEREAMEAQHGS